MEGSKYSVVSVTKRVYDFLIVMSQWVNKEFELQQTNLYSCKKLYLNLKDKISVFQSLYSCMYVFSSLLQMEDSVGRALGRVTVYSIQGCPHCLQAKATLGRLEVPVCEVDLGRHPELRATVKELTGRSTVPQIFFNSVHVGGNDDLQKLVRS